MSREEFVALLNAEVAKTASMKEWAAAQAISPVYVSNVKRGLSAPGQGMADAVAHSMSTPEEEVVIERQIVFVLTRTPRKRRRA